MDATELDVMLADAAHELRAVDLDALAESVELARARLTGTEEPELDSIRNLHAVYSPTGA